MSQLGDAVKAGDDEKILILQKKDQALKQALRTISQKLGGRILYRLFFLLNLICKHLTMKSLLSFLLVIIMATAFSCKHKAPEKDTFTPSFSTFKSDSTGTEILVQRKRHITGFLHRLRFV